MFLVTHVVLVAMRPSCGNAESLASGIGLFPTRPIGGDQLVLSVDARRERVLYAGPVTNDVVRSLWAEPRATPVPPRSWRDWTAAAVFSVVAVVDGVFADDVLWRPASVIVGLVVAVTLLWRRSEPLVAVSVAAGAIAALGIAAVVAGGGSTVLAGSLVVALVLTYSLVRWGSGREAALGLVLIVMTHLITDAATRTAVVESILGSVAWLLAGVLGAFMHYRANARLGVLAEAQLREREQLARELHDSVAHHVSAIAVQAQAGRAVAATDPDAAVGIFDVIDQAASRALGEMRDIVGALRQGDDAELAPPRVISDLSGLASARSDGAPVRVELRGDFTNLALPVQSAVYRIARESVTNAHRHARHATRVTVVVADQPDDVSVTIRDDGDASHQSATPSIGFGLIGMAERAKLLGGSFESGPGSQRGWTTRAVLPKPASSS